MSTFENMTDQQKAAFRREFENPDTERVRRVELLTLLQEGANESKIGRPCPRCKNYLFFAPHHEALIAGHVYSNAGLMEVRITGYCEFCFDLITAEPEEGEE